MVKFYHEIVIIRKAFLGYKNEMDKTKRYILKKHGEPIKITYKITYNITTKGNRESAKRKQ